jgi:hypothetical protein
MENGENKHGKKQDPNTHLRGDGNLK